MKIIAIGRNYADHIKELNNATPEAPVIFLKPDTAILKNNAPFYYPDFSKDIHHEVEILVKISREGKHIEEKFAHKYYEEIGLGIDFTARDLQSQLKTKGLPWELAKGFDGSAPISEFVPKSTFSNIQNIGFRLDVNGVAKQEGNTSNMINSIDKIIAYVSTFISFRKGDIIFTGTPAGVGPVVIGDRLEGYIENNKMFDFLIK